MLWPRLIAVACAAGAAAQILQPSDEIEASGVTVGAIEQANRAAVLPLVKDMVSTSDFYRYYFLDLYGRPCPFWPDDGLCGNRACAVDTIDDDSQVPEIWRRENLGSLSAGSISADGDFPLSEESCVLEAAGGGVGVRDYCIPEDESMDSQGVYVSLVDNPERFTGYVGEHANTIWRAIYTENCFEREELGADAAALEQVVREDSKHVALEGGERGRAALNADAQCVEKRAFYKVISGMHASISTHLAADYLDADTEQWGPSLPVFLDKVGRFPDRVANIYFNYALVSKAVAKLRDYLDDFTFCTAAQSYDNEIRRKTALLAMEAAKVPELLDVSAMFLDDSQLKEEFRLRFVNVSRIIDCTGCDKCRLWGKLQVTGYATALKLLFELPDGAAELPPLRLRRTEMVALINTYDRLARSIDLIAEFRAMAARPQADRLQTALAAVGAGVRAGAAHLAAAWADYWARPWSPEFSFAGEGLRFILRSYVELPKNLWRLGLYHADRLWTRFIGRDEILVREHYAQQQTLTAHDEL
ncbi:endoplasmic reticulum Oxidoreductin 1-domain-containing protein [Dipodascopsis tothii]|uniref:endoplasmic reticulum Oxidoreductin 1-domain-containing protein n=1 Tax=Dipodascopsis tothii TaxID=44089 RepID=UPI0034CD9F6F